MSADPLAAAERHERTAAALEKLQDEMRDADSIGETRLSGLFHEARTSSERTWSRATAFLDVEGSEAMVSTVAKIRDGRWAPQTRDAHSVEVTVPVCSFMSSDEFRRIAVQRIDRAIRAEQQAAEQHRNAPKHAAAVKAGGQR